MHKILFSFLLLFITTTAAVHAQEIKWMSMNEALKAQKENPKRSLWMPIPIGVVPCKMLDKNTFSNKDVAKYVNENYYPVKFNAEGTDTITTRRKPLRTLIIFPVKVGVTILMILQGR